MTKQFLTGIVQEFEQSYETSIDLHKNFGQTFKKILEDREITEDEFCEMTNLSEKTLDRYIKNLSEPSMESIVTFAIAFEIDIVTITSLLQAGGYAFDLTDRKDCAYMFLIQYCNKMSIGECNAILQELGIPKRNWLAKGVEIEKV